MGSAHVPISHLPPLHLYPQGAYSDQVSTNTTFFFAIPLPPQASSSALPVGSDEEAAGDALVHAQCLFNTSGFWEAYGFRAVAGGRAWVLIFGSLSPSKQTPSFLGPKRCIWFFRLKHESRPLGVLTKALAIVCEVITVRMISLWSPYFVALQYL